MARRYRSFYDRPAHQRITTKIVDGVISMSVVYLLSPYLMQVLAPVQANINAKAAAQGAEVSNVGTAQVANQLLAQAGS